MRMLEAQEPMSFVVARQTCSFIIFDVLEV